MKPSISILEQAFRYVPSVATSVADTWRRFGWRPPSGSGRQGRLRAVEQPPAPRVAVRIGIRDSVPHR